jgi:hypothetical protein
MSSVRIDRRAREARLERLAGSDELIGLAQSGAIPPPA